MITRDNPYLSSKISYECNISNQDKSTLICDFRKGQFHLESFDPRDNVFLKCYEPIDNLLFEPNMSKQVESERIMNLIQPS